MGPLVGSPEYGALEGVPGLDENLGPVGADIGVDGGAEGSNSIGKSYDFVNGSTTLIPSS